MPNFNQTIIAGHSGKDAELRYLPSGDAVANLSVAVTEHWKDKNSGKKKESTTWFRVNAFGKLAEICGEYVKKGTPVLVAGKMQSRKWTDKDGVERESWELRADSMQLLGGRSDNPTPEQPQNREAARERAAQPGPPQRTDGAFDDIPDDIPF